MGLYVHACKLGNTTLKYVVAPVISKCYADKYVNVISHLLYYALRLNIIMYTLMHVFNNCLRLMPSLLLV